MAVDISLLTAAAIRVIHEVQRNVLEDAAKDPQGSFEDTRVGQKDMAVIDLEAERYAKRSLRRLLARHRYGLRFAGEEQAPVEYEASQKLPVKVHADMVDGTDLVERKLGNWCSALAFYDDERILAAFIGIPNEAVFYAIADVSDRSFKELAHASRDQPRVVELKDRSIPCSLREASVAFYGQKAANFLAVVGREPLVSHLRGFQEAASREGKKLGLRLYNFAGNPMMTRMIDTVGRRIDAVFELKGQRVHDVVPGAFVAQRAGAHLCDLNGQAIDLHQALLKADQDPEFRLRYVLASTQDLAREILECLGIRVMARPIAATSL